MKKLHIDFETRSAVDLKKSGSYIYAADPSTDVLCCAFGTPKSMHLWIPGQDEITTQILKEVAHYPLVLFVAHNAAFEMDIWQEIMVKRYGFPAIPINRWRCTMAKAYACGLPGKLEEVAKVLKLQNQKDMSGSRTMLTLSKPNRKSEFYTPADKPDEFQQLYNYCRQDVLTEMELDGRLPDLSDEEQKIWEINEEINRSGITIDRKSVENAIKLSEKHKELLTERFKAITGGDFLPSQRKVFGEWLKSQGYSVDDTKATTLEKITGEGPVQTAIKLFLAANKTSLAKYPAMLARISDDNRLRGLAAYHAAHTGRFGGRGVQVQNLPRSKYPAEKMIIDIATGDYEHFISQYEEPVGALSSAIRNMFIPSPGCEFLVGDLSGIESRVTSWVARQMNKLDDFRKGVDPYLTAATGIYGRPITKENKEERSVGKVAELALGYQGGISSLLSMANAYRLDLEPILMPLWATATDDEKKRCQYDYHLYVQRCEDGEVEACTPLLGMSCSLVKRRWRSANADIVHFWHGIEKLAIATVETGMPMEYGALKLYMDDIWFCIQLPSGRPIRYAYPKISERDDKETLTYDVVDGITKRWLRTPTYGGSLTENIVQAISRDIFVEMMQQMSGSIYKIKMHVHDEVVAEVPEGAGDDAEFKGYLQQSPSWAPDLPIASEVWRGKGYEKR
jgi:DNA polymerase